MIMVQKLVGLRAIKRKHDHVHLLFEIFLNVRHV
jgi:REP element-mobilizing transposase RayT